MLKEKIIAILLKKGFNLTSFGRERSDALALLESLQDTIEEHLWKLFAYHKHRKRDVKGWLTSLNKHIPKLIRFRIPKKGKKYNYGYAELYDKLYIEPFGTQRDINSLIDIWANEGYPQVKILDKTKLEKLVKKYINCILTTSKFIVTEKDLN